MTESIKVKVVQRTKYRGVKIEMVKWTNGEEVHYGYCLPNGVLEGDWTSVIGQASRKEALRVAKEAIDFALYSRL